VTQIHTYDIASGNTTFSRTIPSVHTNSLVCAPMKPTLLSLGTLTADWASQTLYTTCQTVTNTSTNHSIVSMKPAMKNFQKTTFPIAIANHIVLLLESYSNTSFYIVTVPSDTRNQTTLLWSLDVPGYPRVLTTSGRDGWMLSYIHIHYGRLYALGNNGSVTAILTWANPLPLPGESPAPLAGTPSSELIQAFTFTSVDTLIVLLSVTSFPKRVEYPILAQYRYASFSKQWFLSNQYLFENRSHVPIKMTTVESTDQSKLYGVTLQQMLEYTLGVSAEMTPHVETRVLSTAPKGFNLHDIAYLPGPTSVPKGWMPTGTTVNHSLATNPPTLTSQQIRAPRMQSIAIKSDSTMTIPSWSISPLPTRSSQVVQQIRTSTTTSVPTTTLSPTVLPTPLVIATTPAILTSGTGLRSTPIDPTSTVILVEQNSHVVEIIIGVIFGVVLSISALGFVAYYIFIYSAKKGIKLPTYQKSWKPPMPPKVRPMTQNPLIHHGIHPGTLISVEETRSLSARLNESREERVKVLAKGARHDTPTLQGQEEGNVPTMSLI
jgi:hypothetical protein